MIMGIMDVIRYPGEYLPDYLGETSRQKYARERAELVTSATPATSTLPVMSAPPARTRVAVANATGTRATEDRGFDPEAAQSVQVPKGSVSTPQARAEGYPGLPIRENTVSLAGGGLPGITFNTPPSPVADAAQAVAPNVGLLPPEFHSQIAELLDAAKPLINSKGIVDRLRGRQLLGARERLIQGATQIAGAAIGGANAQTAARGADAQMLGAQTGAFRASNEVPLALLQSATQKYGVDVGADTSRSNAALAADTSRYHTDVTNATARHGIDSRTAIDLPEAQIKDMAAQAIAAGDMERAQAILSAGRTVPPPKELGWTANSLGGPPMRVRPDGRTEVLIYDPKTGKSKIEVVGEEDATTKGLVRSATGR